MLVAIGDSANRMDHIVFRKQMRKVYFLAFGELLNIWNEMQTVPKSTLPLLDLKEN